MPKTQIEINAETRKAIRKLYQLEKKVDDLGKASNKAGKEGGKSFNKMGLAIAGLKTAGITAVAVGLAAVAKTGIQTAASYELQKQKLSVLLGGVEQANTLFAEMREFAKATPLQLDTINTATTRLLAFGVAQEEVLPLMKRLGDLSLGNAESLNTLTDAYGKIKVSGRASMEDINRIADRGVPIFTELANVMGIATSEVRSFVSKGAVGFDEIHQAITSMTGQGGKFYNLMEGASQTLLGKWSTLKDSFKDTAVILTESLVDPIKHAIDGLNEFLALFKTPTKRLSIHELLATGTIDTLQKRIDEINISIQELQRMSGKEIPLNVKYEQIEKAQKEIERLNLRIFQLSEKTQKSTTSDTGDTTAAPTLTPIIDPSLLLQGNKIYAKALGDSTTVQKIELAQRKKELAKYGLSEKKINEIIAADFAKKEREKLLERQEVVDSFENLRMSDFEREKKSLQDQYNIFKDVGVKEIALEHWKQQELVALRKKYNRPIGVSTGAGAITLPSSGGGESEDGGSTKETKGTALDDTLRYFKAANEGYNQIKGLVQEVGVLQDQNALRELASMDAALEKHKENKEEIINDYIALGLSKEEAEKKFNDATEKLEKKKLKKENELKKKQFKQEQGLKIASTLMAGALAAVQAFAQSTFLGMAMGGIIASLTATKVGVIAAQSFPALAEGGIVPAQGQRGGLYRLGDKNRKEVVIPLHKLNKYLKRDDPMPPTKIINVSVHIDGAALIQENELGEYLTGVLDKYDNDRAA